jgi:hypothetical protein
MRSAWLAPLVFLAGCNPPTATAQKPPSQHYPTPEDRIAALEGRVTILEQSVQEMQQSSALESIRLGVIPESIAKIDPSSKDYSLVETNFGVIPVVVETAKPYLDGYNVDLLIGNTTSITFRGAKLTFYWAGKNKSVQALHDFYPNRYTREEINISPAKQEDLKNLSIGIAFNSTLMLPPLQAKD